MELKKSNLDGWLWWYMPVIPGTNTTPVNWNHCGVGQAVPHAVCTAAKTDPARRDQDRLPSLQPQGQILRFICCCRIFSCFNTMFGKIAVSSVNYVHTFIKNQLLFGLNGT